MDSWTITKHMRFNKNKHWTVLLGRGNPGFMYRMGYERLKNSFAERDLGVGEAKEAQVVFPFGLAE